MESELKWGGLRAFNHNGVEGYGGSIDSHSIAAGSGMEFVGSGYGSFSQVSGNVLLGFSPSPWMGESIKPSTRGFSVLSPATAVCKCLLLAESRPFDQKYPDK